MRIVSKILAGILMGIFASLAATRLAAVFVSDGNSNIVFAIVFFGVLTACLLAPTGRRAWGRGSLLSGILFVALPLSTLALSASVSKEVIASSGDATGAEVAGAAIATGLIMPELSADDFVSLVTGQQRAIMERQVAFIGFIVGGILIILGLVLSLGGTRNVRVVEK